MMTTRRPGCHRGAVVLEIAGLENLDDVYRCDCSYCARCAAIMTAVPKSPVRILRVQDNISDYFWGTQTAKHSFCRTWRIYIHHRRRVDPDQYGLNVAVLEGMNPRDLGDVGWSAKSHR